VVGIILLALIGLTAWLWAYIHTLPDKDEPQARYWHETVGRGLKKKPPGTSTLDYMRGKDE